MFNAGVGSHWAGMELVHADILPSVSIAFSRSSTTSSLRKAEEFILSHSLRTFTISAETIVRRMAAFCLGFGKLGHRPRLWIIGLKNPREFITWESLSERVG
jgi:hypothetical protein